MERKTIAILPFQNKSDASWDYLAEGLTELTINTLKIKPTLHIISKESVQQFLNMETETSKCIYDLLQIDILLTASLEVKENFQLEILAEQKDEEHPLWKKFFMADLKQIIFFGNELSDFLNEKFVNGLTIINHKTPKLPRNRQAYQAYLLGNHYLNKWARAYVELALAQFEKVTDLEPDFVPAYLGIAKSVIHLVSRGFRLPDENYPNVNILLDRMLLLYPSYGELYIYKGIIEFFYLLDWDSAYKNIEKGLKNFSEASEAYTQLSFLWYGLRQYDRALDAIHVAMEYNPLSTSLLNMKGDILLSAERYEEAIKVFQSILELHPKDKVAYENLMYIGALQGKKKMVRKYLRLINEGEIASYLAYPRLGHVYAFLKMEKETQTIIDHWQKGIQETQGHIPYGRLANTYTAKGEWEKVMECLEKLFNAKSGLLFILTDPQFKPIRKWERYQRLEQQIKLPKIILDEKTIIIQTDLKKTIEVNPKTLLYAFSEEKYTTIVVYNNFRLEKTLLRLGMKNLVHQLPSDIFFQCHRSFTVNKTLVFKISGNARKYILKSIEYGFEIPVSRSKINEMKDIFRLNS